MKVQLPEWGGWLDVPVNLSFERVRHRVLVGGRGGAKSWTVAHKIVERARRSQVRILCTREYQNSIRDSSKKLIEDCIERMGFGLRGDCFFTSKEHEIRGRNGSVITFLGLNGKDAAIKSLEGYDLAWVEEAATLSQASVDALVPTIRKEGSEIWWTYNPRFSTDPVDRMFRGEATPPGSIVLEVQWRDNPWFPEVLRRDKDYDRLRDPEKHSHVWEGGYVLRSEAQVFRNWSALPFEAPEGALFRFGADWGFSRDPTVLIRCFIGSWAGEPGTSAVVAIRKDVASSLTSKPMRWAARSMLHRRCLPERTHARLQDGRILAGFAELLEWQMPRSPLTVPGPRRSTLWFGVASTS
jgi:phage terminase large subunit